MRTNEVAVVEALPADLPEIAFTKSGLTFNPNDDVWRWVDGTLKVRLDFRTMSAGYQHLCIPLKRCLMVFTADTSSSYVKNLFDAFIKFTRVNEQRNGDRGAISAVEIAHFSSAPPTRDPSELGKLSALLQKWFRLGIEGVEESCVDYLRGRRKPGNVKGKAVRTRDPEEGPFSSQEFDGLFKSVDSALQKQILPLWTVVLFRLLTACGGRIKQYAALKVCDFQPAGESEQATLLLPQVKDGAPHPRTSFLQCDITARTSELLQEHIENLAELGMGSSSALFPKALVQERSRTTNEDAGEEHADFIGHCEAGFLGRRFSALVSPIAPRTARLGNRPTPINTRRFRYTFGTRMAEEGCSKAVLADRLGHTDLQNVDVYFEASPAIVENIDRALDASLAPIAAAFRGKVVEGEQAASVPTREARIIDFRVSTAGVGSCSGCRSGCRFNKPVACYTCFRFEPWLDAPHERVLIRLLEERSRIDDQRVASVNDDAIEAVREVIAECAAIKEQERPAQAQS